MSVYQRFWDSGRRSCGVRKAPMSEIASKVGQLPSTCSCNKCVLTLALARQYCALKLLKPVVSIMTEPQPAFNYRYFVQKAAQTGLRVLDYGCGGGQEVALV